MALIKPLFLLLSFVFILPCHADNSADMVKRINERYDDFFNWHRSQEERMKRFNHGVDERKNIEKAHAQRIEKARVEYVKARRARPSDESLRLKWEAGEKERSAQNEMLRRRFVQQKDAADQYLLKGRKIPELKEFDLENY